jgi:hypothetical protein
MEAPDDRSVYLEGWSCKCGKLDLKADQPIRAVKVNKDSLADVYYMIVGERESVDFNDNKIIVLYLVKLKTGFVPYSFDGEGKETIDCSYPKPPAFEGQEFRYIGNSGIPSRNNWHIDLPIVKEKVVVYEIDKYIPSEVVTHTISVESLPEPTEVELEFYDADTLRRYNEFIRDYKFQTSLAAAPKVNEFMEVKEANKDKWYDFIEYLDGKDFLVLNKYVTTRGNVTLLLHPVSDVLKVPDGYKGIVIGKGGSNIKALCQRYGRKFKVV